MTADQEEANRTKNLLKASILMKATPYSAESSPGTSVRGEMEMKEEEDEAGSQPKRTPEVKIFIHRQNNLRFVYTYPKPGIPSHVISLLIKNLLISLAIHLWKSFFDNAKPAITLLQIQQFSFRMCI